MTQVGAQNRPEDFGGENNFFPLPVMDHVSSMVTVHTFTIEAHKMSNGIGHDTEGVSGEFYFGLNRRVFRHC
jgi:hypothetical protein